MFRHLILLHPAILLPLKRGGGIVHACGRNTNISEGSLLCLQSEITCQKCQIHAHTQHAIYVHAFPCIHCAGGGLVLSPSVGIVVRRRALLSWSKPHLRLSGCLHAQNICVYIEPDGDMCVCYTMLLRGASHSSRIPRTLSGLVAVNLLGLQCIQRPGDRLYYFKITNNMRRNQTPLSNTVNKLFGFY